MLNSIIKKSIKLTDNKHANFLPSIVKTIYYKRKSLSKKWFHRDILYFVYLFLYYVKISLFKFRYWRMIILNIDYIIKLILELI